MYLRKIQLFSAGTILLLFGISTFSTGASAHSHHQRHSYRVSLSLKYFHGRPDVVHLRRRHQQQPGNDFTIASVHGPLASKAEEIVGNCGSTVISALRPGARIAGTGHTSLHASGRAVDIKGNPHCIYSHLQGWPGGYSVDYGAVQHVHVSLGGFEDGRRFVHNGSHHRHHRYT